MNLDSIGPAPQLERFGQAVQMKTRTAQYIFRWSHRTRVLSISQYDHDLNCQRSFDVGVTRTELDELHRWTPTDWLDLLEQVLR